MDRLTAMEISVRAVDSGSFLGVATQPRFGQAAVLKAIPQLENRSGTRLFMRSAYYPTATAANAKLTEQGEANRDTPRLSLSAVTMFYPHDDYVGRLNAKVARCPPAVIR